MKTRPDAAFRNLLFNLVRRDLTVRYKSTVLGFFWSFLKPLALTAIFYVVFTWILGIKLQEERVPFVLHLLTGMLAWNFMAGATGEAMGVIVANANLVKKVRLPLVAFPIATVCAHFVHFILGLAVLAALLVLLGSAPGPEALLAIPLIALLALLTLALALILSALNVFYRDIGSIWEVFTSAWFYATPIVYALPMASERIEAIGGRGLLWAYLLNPMTPILLGLRRVLLYAPLEGLTPPPVLELPSDLHLVAALGIDVILILIILLIGKKIFSRFARSFADEL